MRKRRLALAGLAIIAALLFVGLFALSACSPGGALAGSLPFVAVGAALTADRKTPRRDGEIVSMGVAAAKKIYAGALVARDANGYATPGVGSIATLLGMGKAEAQVDNSSGSNGAVSVDVRKGVFRFANDGTDTVTIADIGTDCYIKDDQTVGNVAGTNSVAGKVVDVDSDGVWVKFD